MNILFASGGSGGHMAPAIAVAERLTQHQCIFVMSHKKVDEIFAQKYAQFSFIKTDAKPFKASPIDFWKFLCSQIATLRFALGLLTRKKIDLVIAFGGFTAFAFVLAAKIKRIPSILYESNVIPGKANRLSALFADKIFLPDDVLLNFRKKNTEHIGFPIRQEFVELPKIDARAKLGWPPLKKIILLMGGSQGATSLNEWVQQNFTRFAHHNVDIYCIAGNSFTEEKRINFEDCTLHMLPFCNNMNLVLRACDLVITRAGASTIAECQFCKKPMVLIPHPDTTNQHQLANARKAEQQGIAIVVEQAQIDTLAHQILEIISNSAVLPIMQRNLEKTFVPNVAEQMATSIENFMHNKSHKNPG